MRRFFRAVFRVFQIAFILGVAALMVGTIALCTYIYQIVETLPDGQTDLRELEYGEIKIWKQHTEIYSDIAEIREGAALSRIRRRLARLEYEPASLETLESVGPGMCMDEVAENGSGTLAVFTRPFEFPRLRAVSGLHTLHFEKGALRSIQGNDGGRRSVLYLEPELLAELYNTDDGATRRLIPLNEAPDQLKEAILAVEDHEFEKHPGIHVRRLIVTLGTNMVRGERHGASTITQQLARNILLNRGKTIPRKVREWALATLIERRFSKDQILERYMNFVDFGRRYNREMRGVREAARLLFDKEVSELTLAECALLAGLPNRPTAFSPVTNPEASTRRRNFILGQMLRREYIDQAEYEEAVKTELTLSDRKRKAPSNSAPYFAAHIEESLKRIYSKEDLYMRGMRVYTTLDPLLQEDADRVLLAGLKELDQFLGYPDFNAEMEKQKTGESPSRPLTDYVRGCIVAVDVETGRIVAMAGGRDWSVLPFNHVTQGLRQPGSAFKPIVYAAAWENGMRPSDTIIDEPWSFNGWTPENYTRNEYLGEVDLKTALIRSLNIPTARLLNERLDVETVVQTARNLGIASSIGPHPSIALGTAEATPLEMTAAYAAFANGGYRVAPMEILYVTPLRDVNRVIDEYVPKRKRALSPESAEMSLATLRGVLDISGGTARRARSLGFYEPAGGKTGTTSGYADAWFIGFTPRYAAGVWIGFDDRSNKVRRSGSEGALPIWVEFMKSVVEEPQGSFPASSSPSPPSAP